MKFPFVFVSLSILICILRLEHGCAFVAKSSIAPGRKSISSVVHSTTISQQQGSAINVVNMEDSISFEETTQNLLNGGYEDDNSVLSIMQAWCKTESVEGAEMVQQILSHIEDEVDAGNRNSLRPHHYNIAVNAWAKSGHKESPKKAEEVFDRMKDRGVMIDRVAYNTLMNAHALRRDTAKVKEILNLMEKDCPEELRTADYNILLASMARLGQAKEAEEVVKNMVDQYYKGESECLPDGISYNIILDAWAKSDSERCGTRAEMILDAMEEREDSDLLPPNSRSYVTAMWAVIRSGETDVVRRVEAIWERAENRGILKDPFVLTTLMNAYATEKPHDASTKVAEMLQGLERINPSVEDKNVVYNAALKLLKESRDERAVAYAEELFQRMIAEGVVDHVSYGTMILICTNQQGAESLQNRVEDLLNGMEREGVAPTTGVMNSVMSMWVRKGDLTRAAEVLDQMEEAYDLGNKILAPNVVSYTTLMNGWNKSGRRHKAEQTQVVFDRMQKMYESGNGAAEPNLVSYVTLVESIVKSKEDGVAVRVEDIVRGMYENYKTGKSSVKPNAQIISTAINCWSQSGDREAGERAEGLLNWMLGIRKSENDITVEPNEYAFASGKFG